MTWKLMLKVHRDTKLKYLCVTRKDNYKEYTGSGIYWLNHLKIHGRNIKTFLLYEDIDRTKTFINQCKHYSEKWDIVNNNDFANLMIENGNTSWIRAAKLNSFGSLWQYRINQCKNTALKLKQLYSTPHGFTIRETISKKLKEFYNTDKGIATRKRAAKLISATYTDEKRKKYSIMQSERLASLTAEERILRGNKISQTKLNLDESKKAEIALKIKNALQISEKRKAYDKRQSQQKQGGGNPAATPIIWDNLVFNTASELFNYAKIHNMTRDYVKSQLNDPNITTRYKIGGRKEITITCPYCNKSGNSSGMKRWHFNNCKEKK